MRKSECEYRKEATPGLRARTTVPNRGSQTNRQHGPDKKDRPRSEQPTDRQKLLMGWFEKNQ